MADYPRFNDLFEIALREMILRNPLLTEETIRTLGTDSNSIAAMMAQVGEEVVRQCAITATNRLLSTAEDEELDRVVYDWFGLIRNDAAASMVSVLFTRPAPGAAGTLPQDFKVATADGVEFRLAMPLSFGTTDLALSGLCRCTVTGIIGNVGIGTINQMVDTASFDLTFTCNNAARAAGGGKRETNDEFRNRARQFWLVARRGTLGAIQFGALEVDGVGTSAAREVPIVGPTGQTVAEWVSLTVADRSGYGNALLQSAVTSEMDNWRAAGVYVQVLAASVSVQQITARFPFVPGIDTIAATERIRQAIINYTNGLRIEEALRKDAIFDIIRRDRDVRKDVVTIPGVAGLIEVMEPAGDVIPLEGSTTLIRTDYAHVKLN